ncbi:MAG: ATP-binding protein, partial [Alphaproteobacteria bacterium]|nr:ATP-binding protein [Alphaproteobacteria bacterium]
LELHSHLLKVERGVQEALERVAHLVEEKGIQLIEENRLPDDLELNVDTEVFQQIVFNLLINAIHYGGAGKKILVKTDLSADKKLTLAIADQGTQLSYLEQRRIFQPLVRLDQHRGLVDGLGIGLTLSRELASVMNGHLDILTGEDAIEVDGVKGNTFLLSFDLKKNELVHTH